ncbi:MAG: methyltransferase family protein [Methylococcales bacterium]
MATHALIAFLAMPGMVAFAIPVAWLWHTVNFEPAHPFGLILLAFGLVALLSCIRHFFVSGRGTLAPWAPPENLVTVGLYRYSRNPMYLSVAAVLLGWVLSFGSIVLLAYAIVTLVAFHLQVVLHEEPGLARTYGREWEQYASRVPRWLKLTT